MDNLIKELPPKPRYLYSKCSHARPANYATKEKNHRNSGKPYRRKALKNRKPTLVKGKKGQQVICSRPQCKLNCFEKFSASSCIKIADCIWKTNSVHERRHFVARYVWYNLVDSGKRWKYFLPIKYTNANFQDENMEVTHVLVCRQFFCGATALSFDFIRWTVDRKLVDGWQVEADKRGGARKGMSEEKFSEVANHINSVERLPGHYGRRGFNTKKQFIDAFINRKKMWNSYCNERNDNFERSLVNGNAHLHFRMRNDHSNFRAFSCI